MQRADQFIRGNPTGYSLLSSGEQRVVDLRRSKRCGRYQREENECGAEHGLTVRVRHRQPLTVDWKLRAHGGWLEPMVRPTGHVETSLNARSKTSATLPVWTVTLNASAMHSNVVSWKAKMK